jgi:hypothetical protein
MPDILRGYSFDRAIARYRDTTRGQFVSRARITDLLEQNVNGAEQRLASIVQGIFDGSIRPAYGQTLMREELRRMTLQNIALGKGGFDRLNFADYGKAGRELRDTYQRMTGLMRDIQNERVTLPQAMNRIHGYVGNARTLFYEAEREAMRQSDRRYEERRVLNARESCVDCVRYAGMGWQPFGVLPAPGSGSRCGTNCRCSLEWRVVETVQTTVPVERMVVA